MSERGRDAVTGEDAALEAIVANTPDRTFEQAGGFGYTDQIAVALEAHWKTHPSGPVIVSRLELAWLIEGYARARLSQFGRTPTGESE